MRKTLLLWITSIFAALFLFSAVTLINAGQASAHEAYVLTATKFQEGLQTHTAHPLAGLLSGPHLKNFLIIAVLVFLSYVAALILTATKAYVWFERVLEKIGTVGPLIIRLAISASFFEAAQSNVIFGPELALSPMAASQIIRYLLFFISLLILFGVYTEIAAAVGIAVFIYAAHYYGVYMVAYANYFGELVVLMLFGSRFLSGDLLFFGKKRWFAILEKYKELEVPIVRVLYGVALIYAGYTIKFLHQGLTIDVYNQYHLMNFFHTSAEFIAAGAGASEVLIGLFILIGFMMRWTVFISLVFITLSILYFQELLWPHLMLYGISISLIINARDKFTVDRYFIPWAGNLIKKFARQYINKPDRTLLNTERPA